MGKVLLVNVSEGDVWCSKFNTILEAYEDMKESLCQVMHWNEDDFNENIKDGNDYLFSITETSAYANADDGDNKCDWLIVDIEKPFVLVSIVDREICVVGFDTLETAQNQMLKELKECPDWEDWEEDFEFDEETDEYGVHSTHAWANASGVDCNWLIVNIDELED